MIEKSRMSNYITTTQYPIYLISGKPPKTLIFFFLGLRRKLKILLCMVSRACMFFCSIHVLKDFCLHLCPRAMFFFILANPWVHHAYRDNTCESWLYFFIVRMFWILNLSYFLTVFWMISRSNYVWRTFNYIYFIYLQKKITQLKHIGTNHCNQYCIICRETILYLYRA